MVAQWLTPQASKAGDLGLIPGQGSRSCVPTVKDPECHKEEPTLGNEDLARSNLNLAQPHTHTHTHTHTHKTVEHLRKNKRIKGKAKN